MGLPLLIIFWCLHHAVLSAVVLLFHAEQHRHTGQHQQHADTAEQECAKTTGDRQLEAAAVDDGNGVIRSRCLIPSIGCTRVLVLFQFSVYIGRARSPLSFVLLIQLCINRLGQQVVTIQRLGLDKFVSTLRQARRSVCR